MLFNSLSFLLFFPLVTALYWLSSSRLRNYLLLVASYFFYMNWEPVYAILILFSTITTFFCGLRIEKSRSIGKRKKWLVLCLLCNFSVLFIFKYLDFATECIFSILGFLGLRMPMPRFELLLPVGISFYTFQAVGYTIDVWRKNIHAEKHFPTYALFVSFFPQLVAGPIERARNLLPQMHHKHTFRSEDYIEGLKLMIWGYFLKLCIAENVAPYVSAVYGHLPQHSGTSVLLATFFFTFQIFCDFGGYSLIAIGAARCMGFKLMNNFSRPYLARSAMAFWRKWHISLSTWFADYVYIPLGGNRCSEIKHQRNLLITMLASGVWHGPYFTFIIWGLYHGILLCINSIWNLTGKRIPLLCGIILTFICTMFGWVFFRANTLSDSFLAIRKIFSDHGNLYYGEGVPSILLPLALILFLITKEIKDEFFPSKWKFMHNQNFAVSVLSSAFMIVVIMLCGNFNGRQFIYFQF